MDVHLAPPCGHSVKLNLSYSWSIMKQFKTERQKGKKEYTLGRGKEFFKMYFIIYLILYYIVQTGILEHAVSFLQYN